MRRSRLPFNSFALVAVAILGCGPATTGSESRIMEVFALLSVEGQPLPHHPNPRRNTEILADTLFLYADGMVVLRGASRLIVDGTVWRHEGQFTWRRSGAELTIIGPCISLYAGGQCPFEPVEIKGVTSGVGFLVHQSQQTQVPAFYARVK